jgi:hypothetical protein
MFGKLFGGKDKKTTDEHLDDASKTLNSGLTGMMAKMTLGGDAVKQMNDQIAFAKQYSGGENDVKQQLLKTGKIGNATVLDIADTGKSINDNPVVRMKLSGTNQQGETFEVAGETLVSRIKVPRVGDQTAVVYDPNDKTKFALL